VHWIKVGVLKALDERDCWLFPLDPQQESLQDFRLGLGLDKHPLGIVDDPTFQVHLFRQTIDKRTKSDALHGATDDSPNALELVASHSPRLRATVTGVCDR